MANINSDRIAKMYTLFNVIKQYITLLYLIQVNHIKGLVTKWDLLQQWYDQEIFAFQRDF